MKYLFVFVCMDLEHFTKLYSWNPNPKFEHHYPRANHFVPTSGHASTSHYQGCLDQLSMEDVIFIPNGDHQDVVPFQDIFWYSGWIMAITRAKYRHLPKRVMRQYRRVQKILRPCTNVAPFEYEEIAQAFRDFMIHVIPLVDRGSVPRDAWWTRGRYIYWLYRVSHP